MKVSERVELYYLEKNKQKIHKIKPIKEVAEICLACDRECKSEKGLRVCGLKTREEAKRK